MPKLALAFDVAATDKASRTLNRIGDNAERTGKRIGRSFGNLSGSVGRPLLALAGAGGVGAVIGSSVKLAATFETTMRQVAVATNEPASRLKELNALALKMGADTTFSAQDAGNAMLELAKSGLTTAEIKAGALAQTLTLAAAGGLELGDAAGYITTGLTQFGLGAEQAGRVAAALAGAANATKASVTDVGFSFAQFGSSAYDAGLSVEEASAAIAAMAKNGNIGSDAGTSLKTMFSRLVPSTEKAAGMMKKLNLRFTDSNDEFVSLEEIAGQLQKSLINLSDADRTAAINTLFGSDARRAALALMRLGSKGVRELVKETSDLTAAEKLAAAATEGTGGALEQMRGSIETAQIALGTALAPVVVDVAKKISDFANGPLTQDIIPALGSFVQGMQNGTGPGGKLANVVGEIGSAAGTAWDIAEPMFSFIGDHPKLFTEIGKDALILAGALKAIGAVKGLTGGLGGLVGKSTPPARDRYQLACRWGSWWRWHHCDGWCGRQGKARANPARDQLRSSHRCYLGS